MKKISIQNNYMPGDEELLGGFVSAKKAQQLLQIKTTKLYYLRQAGDLVSAKIGKQIFIEINSIQKLLKRNLLSK